MPQTPIATSPLKRPGAYPSWIDLLLLLAVFLGATFLGILVARTGWFSSGLATCLAYFLQFSLTIAFALYWRSRRLPGEGSGLQFSWKKVDFTLILWGVVVVMAAGIVIEPLLDKMPESYLEALSSMMGRGGWMMLTSIVLAPLLEELLFRGILQEAFVRKYGPPLGIVLAAAVFGAMHIIPQQVLNAFLIGLVLGFIYYRSRSLVPVMAIHCINNLIAYFTWMIGGEKILSTRDQLPDDTTYYVVYGIACLILLVAFVCMGVTLSRERNRKLSPATDTKPEK